MSRKKRKNTFTVPLTFAQRRALWASLDLLSFLSSSVPLNVDFDLISRFGDDLYALDGDPQTYVFEMRSSLHRICSISLKYACLYLDGEYSYFSMPIHKNIEDELNEFSSDVRSLNAVFSGENMPDSQR